MFDILKTIGEVLIALFIIRYLIQRYNTLGRIREPVRRTLADISTYKAQREATLQHLYVIAEQFSQRESNTLTQASLANMSRQAANFQALAAAYPELKSNQTYLTLMDGVEALEARIQTSRQEYNQAVSNYQTLRSQIPYCFLAPIFGFKPAEYNQKETDLDVSPSVINLPPSEPEPKPLEAPVTPMKEVSPAPIYHCPKCQSELHQLKGKFGPYWRCQNAKCKADFTDDDGKPVIRHCPDCGTGYLHKRTLSHKDYWTCSNYPQCKAKYPADTAILTEAASMED